MTKTQEVLPTVSTKPPSLQKLVEGVTNKYFDLLCDELIVQESRKLQTGSLVNKTVTDF